MSEDLIDTLECCRWPGRHRDERSSEQDMPLPHLVRERDRIADRCVGRWYSLVANGPAWPRGSPSRVSRISDSRWLSGQGTCRCDLERMPGNALLPSEPADVSQALPHDGPAGSVRHYFGRSFRANRVVCDRLSRLAPTRCPPIAPKAEGLTRFIRGHRNPSKLPRRRIVVVCRLVGVQIAAETEQSPRPRITCRSALITGRRCLSKPRLVLEWLGGVSEWGCGYPCARREHFDERGDGLVRPHHKLFAGSPREGVPLPAVLNPSANGRATVHPSCRNTLEATIHRAVLHRAYAYSTQRPRSSPNPPPPRSAPGLPPPDHPHPIRHR